MLESLLTLNKGRVFWMLGALVAVIIAHAALVFLTGTPEALFALFGIGIVFVLVVSAVYTLGRRLIHH
jgi:hypothetical protein